MSNYQWKEKFFSSDNTITITAPDGAEWKFTNARIDSLTRFDNHPLSFRIEFETWEPYTFRLPPEETKQERRRRLIKEMYPQ